MRWKKPIIDILWVLFSAGLVFLMQAGFLSLETGMTRSKNNISVSNGKDTLETLQNQPQEFDLVLLGINMPEMDGIEVAKIIKENKDTCHVAIIFLTDSKENPFPLKRG